jgi:hypothetical protein
MEAVQVRGKMKQHYKDKNDLSSVHHGRLAGLRNTRHNIDPFHVPSTQYYIHCNATYATHLSTILTRGTCNR